MCVLYMPKDSRFCGADCSSRFPDHLFGHQIIFLVPAMWISLHTALQCSADESSSHAATAANSWSLLKLSPLAGSNIHKLAIPNDHASTSRVNLSSCQSMSLRSKLSVQCTSDNSCNSWNTSTVTTESSKVHRLGAVV